jgi:methyl-accepting chemotaxis protein
MGLNRMHIATKLWIFIVLVIAAIGSVAGIGLVRSANILSEGRVEQLSAVELVKVTTQWNGLTQTNAARTLAMVLSAEPAVNAAFKDAVTATSAQITELQKKLEALPLTPADKVQLQKIAELRKSMIELRDKARQLKTDSKAEEAVQLLNNQYIPAVARYVGAQLELVKTQEQRVLTSQAETESRRLANTWGIIGGLVLIIVFIFLATAWLVRSIRQPLEQANELAARIAQGDLSADISTTREDEFGDLLRSLKTMNESLGRMVHQVRQSTDSIATASAEIATGNNDLAQRTEQTSSNLQSTASSMEQLTTTVQHSAENARQASTLAANASSVAQQGGAVVQQVVFTMEEINASSRKISDIIGVIDGIAFQTNILALNAAVEAARAGEQGRGFAVVASEVRSLAQRSAEAAKEIKMLIGTSVDKVASGTKLVSDAGATMSDIVQSVRRVADVIGEITSAASEQSTGIAHVNQAIANLDQMTQQNAALVEQSAAAAESLRDQANQMAQAVSVFKVGGSAMGVPKRPARDITPRAAPLTYQRPQAKPKAALPARKPLAVAPPAKPKAAPAPSPAAESDWESF